MKKVSDNTNKYKELSGVVVSVNGDKTVIQDDKDTLYTIDIIDNTLVSGDQLVISYTGLLNESKDIQNIKIISYSVIPTSVDDEDTTNNSLLWIDNGIFKNYYSLASNYLNKLTIDEKIEQLFLVKYPDNNQKEVLKKYNFAGYVFYERDFTDKTKYEVAKMMEDLQASSKTAILTAVDEEGGSVVRVSSNPKLADSPFLSPSELYDDGGFDLIKQDTINKSKLLNSLGINLNLAPVVDVATDSNNYIYNRTLKQNTELTSTYAKTVINASKGTDVSYTLKHFPGYGNNSDTHTGSSTDNRTYDDIRDNDLPPFIAGIKAGAEAILFSHNTVTSIDADNPASLSKNVHNLLREDLNFTGVIISDDLTMGAVKDINNNIVKAIQAGNNLIIVGDYENAINSVKEALKNGTLTENDINNLVGKTIAWKYYKGLLFDNQK